jgi:hypothetical protein
MSYTPFNSQVFAAACAGAQAAFASSAPQGPIVENQYSRPAAATLALAQAVDTAWNTAGNSVANYADIQSIANSCSLAMRDRGVLTNDQQNFDNAAMWASQGTAIVLACLEIDAAAAAQGITFPALGGAATPGQVFVIRIPVALVTVSSTTNIPSGSVVLRAFLDVTTPYSAGTTIELGTAANAALFMTTAQNTPQSVDLYDNPQDTANVATDPLLVTIAGGPSVGAGFACVEYVTPLT